jgi:hypothetical protein
MGSQDGGIDAVTALRRFEAAMRKLVHVSKKEAAETIAAERTAERPRSKPA